jgi:transcriptional regulator with XRE-family HTH domain
MANVQTSVPEAIPVTHAAGSPINIGQTIRNFRLQRSMSQGDIEKRTGLLRCYLSRVENGHTIPSLETLQKIAGALDLPLSHFFAEETVRDVPGVSMSQEEIHFLTQVQRYSSSLTDSDRRLLLAMVKKFATTASPSIS